MTAKRIDAEELKQRLESTRCALVVGHIKPDGDDVGSVLALTEALRNRGVDADILIADEVGEKFRFLPLAAEIRRELPDKEYDTLFFVDLSTKNRAGDIEWPNVPIVNIDHHVSNPGYADELYLRPEAAAVGEMLTELFLAWQWTITPTMAQALYMAISTDCGFFKYANTTAQTLRMAAELIERGAMPQLVANRTEELPKAALTVLPKVMDTLTFAEGNRMNYMVMDEEAMRHGRDYVDTYLDLARNIQGVELILQFKYAEPQKTYVSFRSKDIVDVSALAAQFGGGGHMRAAGCTVYEDLDSTVAKVLPVAAKVLAE